MDSPIIEGDGMSLSAGAYYSGYHHSCERFERKHGTTQNELSRRMDLKVGLHSPSRFIL